MALVHGAGEISWAGKPDCLTGRRSVELVALMRHLDRHAARSLEVEGPGAVEVLAFANPQAVRSEAFEKAFTASSLSMKKPTWKRWG